MRLQVPGEDVSPRRTRGRYKKKCVCFGGPERSFDGGAPGVGDGPRRQPGVLVGVVGIGMGQIAFVDDPAPAAFEQRGVDHGRVALEFHPLAQPVSKDTRDHGPFGGEFGFLFH